MPGNTLAMCPPLIITKAQIDEMMEKLSKALNETHAFVVKENLMVA